MHVNGCFSAYWADAEDYTKFTKYTGISGNPYKWKKKKEETLNYLLTHK